MDVVVSEGTHFFLLFESRGAQLAWCHCEECFARRSNPEGTRTQRNAAARATVLRGVVRTSLPTLGSMAPCSPPSRPLRAGSAGGLRPVLTTAVRGAGCGIAGRDGETGLKGSPWRRADRAPGR